MPVQWLRYGIADTPKAASKVLSTREAIKSLTPSSDELQLLARLRAMAPHRRRLLADLISDLSIEHEAWRE